MPRYRNKQGKPKPPPGGKIQTADEYRLWAASHEHIAGFIAEKNPELAKEKLQQARAWRRYAEHLEQQAANRTQYENTKPPR
ncbi:MAG TPA: hypothetical protein VM487_06525 [Phycisphaerae bacterium]|nr:hypothetical protein [Phycisphaerae bacterium]